MIEKNKIKIDEGTKRIGKDEMNLIELPFTLLAKRNPKRLKTIEREWIGRDEKGKERKFYKIITGSDKWGLPTFIGEEVYLACMEVSHRQEFRDRTVSTTQYELLSIMKWPLNDGRSYERLIKAFNQLGGVWITTNAFWDNQEKIYKKVGFGIISNYEFFVNERKGKKGRYSSQPSLPLGYFRWDDILFQSIQKGHIKTIDTKLYFSLKSYISKRLYRFVDKRLYNQESFEIDLFRLAFDKLEMTGEAYKHPSKVIQNLQPAIKELKERGIANIKIKQSQSESGYKVCCSPITKPQMLVETEVTTQNPAPSKAEELVNYFHSKLKPDNNNHQPTQKEIQQAQDLLSEYNEEEIKYIIDYALKEAKKTNFQMCYFGAVLNYVKDAIFQLEEKKKWEEEEKARLKKQRELAKLREEYENYKKEKLNSYLSQMSSEEKEQEIEKIKQNFLKNFAICRRWDEKTLRDTVEFHFQEEIKKRIDFLPFQQWVEEKKKNKKEKRKES